MMNSSPLNVSSLLLLIIFIKLYEMIEECIAFYIMYKACLVLTLKKKRTEPVLFRCINVKTTG